MPTGDETADDRRAERRLVGPNAFVAGVTAVALALTTTVWVVQGPPRRIDALLVLVALGLLNRLGPRALLDSGVNLSVSGVMLLTAAALVGPAGAALVGASSVLSQIGRVRRIAALFNVSMLAIVGVLGGLAYQLLGGPTDLSSTGATGGFIVPIGVPLLAADVVQGLANAVLLSAVIHFASGISFRTHFKALLTGTGAAYVAYGLIAFLLVLLWGPAGVGAVSAVLILAPLLVARWALGQYGAELQAHNRTLTALVAAIEIKSPVLIGQSAAVATVCDWIGDEMHLPSAQVEAVRTAGMLHDIGLLGLPSAMLRPDHLVTGEESVLLLGHTAAAARMLDGISFLDRAVVGVIHHHERFDGTGYPAGLIGQDIPLTARIVAVADGYVALVLDREGRPALTGHEALARLNQFGGTVYDPLVLSALGKALARHDRPVLDPGSASPVLGTTVAHDEPGWRVPTPDPTAPAAPASGAPASAAGPRGPGRHRGAR